MQNIQVKTEEKDKFQMGEKSKFIHILINNAEILHSFKLTE